MAMDDHAAGGGAHIGGAAFYLEGGVNGGHHATFRRDRVRHSDRLHAGDLAEALFEGFEELELLRAIRVAFAVQVDFGDESLVGAHTERGLELDDQTLQERGSGGEEDEGEGDLCDHQAWAKPSAALRGKGGEAEE